MTYYLYSDYNDARFPEVVVRGAYQENKIYCMLKDDNIHSLIFLNRYPETYSYALTKGINSGRPLLYTRMGAIIGNILAKQNQPEKCIATDNTDVEHRFETLLDFIGAHGGEHTSDGFSMRAFTAQGGEGKEVILPEFYNTVLVNNASATRLSRHEHKFSEALESESVSD